MHFDGNDTTGSAEEGYGEVEWPNQVNQQIEMDYTCRISDNFKQDMYLNPNGTIEFDFAVDVYAPGQCNDANPCENLNVTLWKGSMEVARQEYAGIDTGDVETRNWRGRKIGVMSLFYSFFQQHLFLSFGIVGKV